MNGQGLMGDKGDQEDDMVEEQVLDGFKYFVFGLGNKTYEYYNAIGRRIDKRMTQVGGQRIGSYGEGDDDDSIEGDYLKWAPTIVKALGEYFGVVERVADGSAPHIPLFTAIEVENRPELYGKAVAKGSKWDLPIVKSKTMFNRSNDTFKFHTDTRVVLKSDKVTVQGTDVVIPRQCYHVELDITDSGMQYTTGDHLGVYASNNSGSVAKLSKFLGYKDPNTFFELKVNPEHRLCETAKPNIENPFNLQTVLSHRLDIDAVLKQHHFEVSLS